MHIKLYPTFTHALDALKETMLTQAYDVHTEKWQGVGISNKPEASMKEILFPGFKVPIHSESLEFLAQDIKPNLPWADLHFETERVSGHPINPGETWKIWPWGNSADQFRTEGEQYNHSYAERYWPKYAGQFKKGILPDTLDPYTLEDSPYKPLSGIRYLYGDLNDVVDLLASQPLTRQAYLPVFFPEDTGAVHGGRIPCSIGYHFIVRGKALHVSYQLRSCDFYRHLRDDIYLTVRLLLWVLDRLRDRSRNYWSKVRPGVLVMQISSLHVFINDWRAMGGK